MKTSYERLHENPNWASSPKPPTNRFAYTVMLMEVGSGLHGISITDSIHDPSDMDLMGIAVENRDIIFGLGDKKKAESWTWRSAQEREAQTGQVRERGTYPRSKADDIDLTFYSLKKWALLATQGNPSALLPLFAPEDFIIVDSQFGKELRELAPAFVSQNCVPRYLGYMKGQRERALDGRNLGRGMRPLDDGDDASVKRWGKWASHMVRLSMELDQMVSVGRLLLPLPYEYADYCKRVRRGEVTVEEAIQYTQGKEIIVRGKLEEDPKMPLPEKPDLYRINEWLRSVYYRMFL